MPTGFDHVMKTSQTAVGKGKVGEKPKPPPGKVGVKVKAAIFFDGTGNNQSNVTKRLKDSSYMVPHWYGKHSTVKDQALDHFESYEQYYSNVALLHFMHRKKMPGEKIVSVYMEGIGTSNDGPDDTPGGGFGAGPTGIVARVNRGISDLAAGIKAILAKEKNVFLEELTVCAFGFSRGAAAARHFCARRTDARGRLNSLCQALGVKPDVVTIRFVGLFDSVSSFDDTDEETPANPTNTGAISRANRHRASKEGDREFLNDVAELHLTLDDPTLGQVVQLAAADEYRQNFSLTTIASARRRGVGFELRLPGAHSDIGGGYARRLPEVREYGYDLPLRVFDFFRSGGWYGPGQSEKDFKYASDDEYPIPIVIGRRQLPNEYQYVGLSIMLRLAAKAQSGMHFGSPNQDAERGIRYIINPGHPLYAIKTALESYALAHSCQPQDLTAPLAEPAYRWLRQHYLHLSWSDRLGFEFRRDAQGLPTRKIITG